jgi:hypothetical protein
MEKKSILVAALSTIFGVTISAAAAQFPINIPKIKVEKPRIEQPTPDKPSTADGDATRSAAGRSGTRGTGRPAISGVNDQPTIGKDSIQIRAFTFSVYRNNYDVWSWVPDIKYSVNGPIASGSRLYVEFTIPGSGPWLKFDCATEATQAGYSMKTECGGRQIPEDKGSTYSGPVNFSIRLANELAGSETTLFSGKMQVGKARSNEAGPKAANHFVYYVDHDWNLPIGYVFYERNDNWNEGDPLRWSKPSFNVAFWTRGEVSGFAEPHLFYDGKEVGKLYNDGQEVGNPNCSTSEVQNNVTQSTTADAPKFVWTRWKCTFYNVLPWNKTRDKNETMFGRLHLFNENPGEYEVKILFKGRLIRSLKFAVDAEGKLVHNRIAATNRLGSDRMIVPVHVIGDLDGPWNRTAWKTDAFYGNPLSGFTVP